MKYRLLAFVPLVFALVLGGAALAFPGSQETVLTVQAESGKLLDFIGCLAAALAFERGDYLSRAWFTYGSCSLLLVVKDAIGEGGSPTTGLVRGLVVLAANTLLAVGVFMLARAWSVAGLVDDPKARARRRAMFAVAALASLAVTGWPLVHDVQSLLGGRFEALVSIASDLGDAVGLALLAPLATTALALRGGVLRWPWTFITLAGVTWLAYDVSSGLIDHWHVGPGLALVGSEALRGAANLFAFSAGIAQRLAVAPDEVHAAS